MTRSERHIGSVTLAYVLSVFSLSSYLLLRAEQTVSGLPVIHTFAYALVTALLLLNAWQFLGWKDGPWETYRKHKHLRTLASFFPFPVAVMLGTIVLHRMLEGVLPTGRSFWLLSIPLWIVAAWTGFVGITEEPIGRCTQRELTRADNITKASWKVLTGLIIIVLGGGAVIEYLRNAVSEILKDFNLVSAGILIAVSAVVSFAIQPWLMAQRIRSYVTESAEGQS